MTASVGPPRAAAFLEWRGVVAERAGHRHAHGRRRRRSRARRPGRQSLRVHDAQRHQPAAARGRRAPRRPERRRLEPLRGSTLPTSGCWPSSPARSSSPCRTRGCTTRCGAASRSGNGRSTRSAIRSPSSIVRGGCCAATGPRGAARTAGDRDSRRRRAAKWAVRRRVVPGVRDRRARRDAPERRRQRAEPRAEITLGDEQILSVTTFPAVDPGSPARRSCRSRRT